AVFTLPSLAGFSATFTDTNPTCKVKGNITVVASGGTAPYTYLWSDGSTNQKDTGLSAGTYSCTVTENGGCKFSNSTTLVNPTLPAIKIAPAADSICPGGNAVLTASGASTYTWLPAASGLSCTNCPNPTASPGSTTTDRKSVV